MVFHGAIDGTLQAYILYALQDKQHKPRELSEKLGVSLATIYKIKKGGFECLKRKKMRASPGRPRKIDTRMERLLIRQVENLRRENPNFTSGTLVEACGLHRGQVSNRTVRRVLNKHGFGYRQARKKGVLSSNDIVCRYRFAKKIRKEKPRDVWTSKVNFYLDVVSFYYKRNPAGQAKAPQGRIWRTKKEGLAEGCTAKGKKEGSGGRVLKLFVAISYNKGVIACHPYEHLDGQFFENFVKANFASFFTKADKGPSRLWLQDGDPSQNAAGVKRALRKLKAELLSIPPRSPHLNPIENLFHSVRCDLSQQALSQNITRESYDEFQSRVITTFLNWPSESIDKIIDSMNGRIDVIIKNKGNRTKY